MISPRLLLPVTQGRSGTKFVSRVLAFFPDVASFHEPAPNFAGDLSAFQRDPSFAVNFLKNEKIPAMQRFADFPVYAETSHLWCQGPLQAWLAAEMKHFADVIILDRPLRAISLSLLQLGTIPGRTQSGRDWYLDPFQKGNLLHWPDKKRFTDYQCCFAYCLEIEERKKTSRMLFERLGPNLREQAQKNFQLGAAYFVLAGKSVCHFRR